MHDKSDTFSDHCPLTVKVKTSNMVVMITAAGRTHAGITYVEAVAS